MGKKLEKVKVFLFFKKNARVTWESSKMNGYLKKT